MHRDFADWYRAVSIMPQAEDLQKRWAGVNAFAKDSRAEDVVELVRLFFGLPQREQNFVESFREAFKKADDAFSMSDNLAEVRVLAGACLVRHFDYSKEWGTLASLGVMCAECNGTRKPPFKGIVEAAQKFLLHSSATIRASDVIAPPKIKAAPAAKALLAELEATPPSFPSLVSVIEDLHATTATLCEWARSAETLLHMRREESDILWWLLGSSSRDLRIPFEELPADAAPLIVAKEMADLTRVLPGPYSASSYMAYATRAGVNGNESTTLAKALAACERAWLTSFSTIGALASLSDLCAVHQAAVKYVEANGKKSWQATFHSATGVRATSEWSVSALSLQAYRERLLCACFSAVETE